MATRKAKAPRLFVPTDAIDNEIQKSGLFTINTQREPDDWVKDLNELRTYADRRRYNAWTRWNEAWRIYNNQFDWSAKAPWQSKNYVPQISLTVEMAASMIRRAMIDAEEWFRLDGYTDSSRQMSPYLEKLVYYYLDLLRFVDNIVPPLKGGLVGSLVVLKCHLAPYTLQQLNEEEVEKQLRGEMVARRILEGPAIQISYPDPYNIWLDPTGRDMFILEEEIMDIATAFDLADLGILNGDVIEKCASEDWSEHEKEVREEQRKQQLTDITHPQFRRQIKLTHFWGSLPNDEGKWALRNGHFVMANQKYLARDPMDNPYTHGKKPYIVGSPFRRPFSVYHKGLIEDVVGLAKAMTELLNLTLDATLFDAIKAFEVDLDVIDDPQQILNGIYPGKVFTKRAGGEAGKMIQQVDTGNIKPQNLEIYNLLKGEYAGATIDTEVPTSPVRSATETVQRQQTGMSLFSEIARNLEGTVLEPTVEMLGHLIVQYHDDFYSPQVREILGDDMATELAMLAFDERIEKFDPDRMKVRASGITSLLNRQDEIQKIMGFLQSLGQFGPELQIILQGFDQPYFFKGIFKRLVRSFGWNEAELLRPAQVAAVAPPTGTESAGPPGATNQPGQGATPAAGQTPNQLDQIKNAVAGGGVPPNRYGGGR